MHGVNFGPRMFRSLSKARGYSAVRMPGLKKPEPTE